MSAPPIKPLLPCPYCRTFHILLIDRADIPAFRRGCLKCNRWIDPVRRRRAKRAPVSEEP
jgi:hypothetical protein